MITTEAPRRRPIFAIAIAFSVLLHLVLAFFYLSANHTFGKQLAALLPHPRPTPSVDQIELSDAIKLEKRTVHVPTPAQKPVPPKPPPRVAVRPEPKPVIPQPVVKPEPPKPKVAPPPPPKPRTIRKEIAKAEPTAAPLTAKAEATGAPKKTPAQVAYTNPDAESQQREPAAPAQQPVRPSKPRLTEEQIAALESQFSKTIQQQRAMSQALTAVPSAEPETMKRYAFQFQGRQGALRRGEGWLSSLSEFRCGPGGSMLCHYLHYEYVWPDGTYESGDVPWPVGYPRNADPWDPPPARPIQLPLPPPMPGWQLTRDIPPQNRILRSYFPQVYPGVKGPASTDG